MNIKTQMSTRANAHSHCTHAHMLTHPRVPKKPIEDPAHRKDTIVASKKVLGTPQYALAIP